MANSTKIVAKIDKDACIGCGACEDICASTAIHIENGIAQVTEEDCIGCGACVDACPLEAIQLA